MDGVLVIDKPAGVTSYQCVARLKKIWGVKKAGHTGTLDPMATGVLPICLGEATKIARYLTEGEKVYRASMVLGIETDTLDLEGQVIARRTPAVTEGEVREVMKRFIGKLEQKPPYFSAVKYLGKPLHRWTRQGVKVDLPARVVEVKSLEVEKIEMPYVHFHLTCSAGTYVRVLCADMGKILGCGASLAALRRLKSGPFVEADAVPFEEEKLKEKVLSLKDALAHIPSVLVTEEWGEKIRKGIQPGREIFEGYDISSLVEGVMLKFVSPKGELLALARWEKNGQARLNRVFQKGNIF